MNHQRSPIQIARTLSILFLVLSIFTVWWGTVNPVLILDASQILYLFSTSAQVLAGVYGLTLTGFVFLRNELSREELEDATLRETNESLKNRYFNLLLVVTGFVLISLALSNVSISGASQSASTSATVLINLGQTAFAVSILAIVYFFLDTVAPGRSARASAALQQAADPTASTENRGDLSEFLRNYNYIERFLERAEPKSLTSVGYETRTSRRRISNSRLAQVLYRNQQISEHLYGRLIKLITLRNSIIHSGDPVVSPAAVVESADILKDLEVAFGRQADEP